MVCDFSSLPFDEKVRRTKEAVLAPKALRADILVEGEIGNIGSGSEIHETAPDLRRTFTTPDEARQFVGAKKRLDVPRIRTIKERTGMFMSYTAPRTARMGICGQRSPPA